MKTNQAPAEVFFTAFKALGNKDREAFLGKEISDSALREDHIDIVLIEEAKKIKGKPISDREYFAMRRKTGTTD